MPRLLSGSILRKGGSGEFLNLRDAQPQLPPTETTATGFTLSTDSLLRTSYRSSLGFIEFRTATMYSSLPEGTIRILATGTSFLSLNTESGTLVVTGGVGVGGNMHIAEDIVVNNLTIGQGFKGINNIVVKGIATNLTNDFNIGQQSIIIGYDSLQDIETSYQNIAIGTKSLNSGTNLSLNIAVGDHALKNLGYPETIAFTNISNINFIPSTPITTVLNENPMKILSSNHGLTTSTRIYVTGVVGITTSSLYTGVYSLINEQVLYADPIDPNYLAVYYNSELTAPVDATSATSYLNGGVVRTPIEITVTTPNLLNTGNLVHIDDIVGTIELNNQDFYLQKLAADKFTLFADPALEEPIDGTGYTSYISNGTVKFYPIKNSNVVYGHNAGEQLINGADNIFIGNNSGKTLTTGSNNIIIGNNSLIDVYTGSGIISLGGDNIINGRNNQVNIGSVFYYDGLSTSTIWTNTRIASPTQSFSTTTGALEVWGGAGIGGNTYIGGSLQVLGTQTSTITNDLSVLGNVTVKKSLTVDGSYDVNLIPQGADVFVQPGLGGTVVIDADVTGSMDNIAIGATQPTTGRFTTVEVTSSATSTSTTTGALTVAGGVGIQGSVFSADGNIEENYRLYSPKVTVTAGTPPDNPKIGDFWIDSTVPAYLQYIKDGTSTFWIQVGAV